MNEIQQKKRETWMVIIMVLLLVLVIMFSKFVLGINFSLLENGYRAFGLHEVRGEQIWALSFESFSGSISTEGVFPENGKHTLTIQSGPKDADMRLELSSADGDETYELDGDPLELNIDADRFRMVLSGNEVLTGFFSAVWQ